LICEQAADKVAADAGRIFAVVAKHFKTIPIESIKSIYRSKPQKAVLILQAA
jgi:hypothetical protein